MKTSDYEYLNNFESVKRLKGWLLQKAGRKEWFSENSFIMYLRGVKDCMDQLKIANPDEFIAKAQDPQALERLLKTWVGHFTERGWSPSTQIHTFSYVKRFLVSNDIEMNWKRITLPKLRFVIQDKAPDKGELRKILMYAPMWLKSTVLLLSTSGLRVGSLEYLKLKHVNFDFGSQVGLIQVPPEATKAKVGYYSFFTEETRDALKKQLEERKSRGEVLTEESPLIRPPKEETATYDSIRFAYCRTLRHAGLVKKSMRYHILHLHSLRKFFRTNLEALLTRSQIERLMGHVSTEYLDGSYFRPPEKDMLENYRKAIPNLSIMEDTESEEFQKKQLLRQASLILTEEKLRLLKDILQRTKGVDQAVEEFRKFKDEPSTMCDGNGKYLIAHSEDEMIQKLHEGFRLVQSLNHDKYLMEIQ